MIRLGSIQDGVEFLMSRAGPALRIATPLGLGKPNLLINALYERVKRNSQFSLTLFTALSLDNPDAKSDLERRFVEPFYKRHFGEGYPRLEYVKDLHGDRVPDNIHIHEFYFPAGAFLKNPNAQRNYISLNYTHVTQRIYELSLEVIVQLVAKSPDGQSYSLSCNPDLTLDIYDLYRQHQKKLLIIGVVHPDLPFLGGDAEVQADFFDALIETPENQYELFAPPRGPVEPTEYMIGLHASRLMKDNGTLQIGIGSLSDALTYCALLRHQQNGRYKDIMKGLDQVFAPGPKKDFYDTPFTEGLYGTSEMLMDGFMHLRKGRILNRWICDRDENARRYLHGAFFLGSKDFYRWLRSLKGEEYEGLSMTRVSKVNDLYDAHELALRRQRKNARFYNSCMQMSLLGSGSSETLENGNVVSGVGGQYNFVAMSHELPDSYSVLMLKSFRRVKGKKVSNIVWSPAQITIPRHLRDVVITEYGIAFLKGLSDEECIQEILRITDSEFQDDLMEQAKKYDKLHKDWKLPESARQNTEANLNVFFEFNSRDRLFPRFPFGSDFTPEEEKLQKALLHLKEQSTWGLIETLAKGIWVRQAPYKAELERMDLYSTNSGSQYLYKKVLLGALKAVNC